MIAFRVADKMFFFGNEVPDRWVMVRNRTTKLVSLNKLHVRDKLKIAFWNKKDALVHCVINKQEMEKRKQETDC